MSVIDIFKKVTKYKRFTFFFFALTQSHINITSTFIYKNMHMQQFVANMKIYNMHFKAKISCRHIFLKYKSHKKMQ